MPQIKNKGFTLISKACKGFTLIELMVAMAIIGVLAVVIIGGFRSSQIRGRDTQRKSDIKQIANALELFYQDYGRYPGANANNQILACPYGTSGACSSGSEMTDGNTIYFKKFPQDPANVDYVYKVSSDFKKYQVYTHLENTEDKNCINGDCEYEGPAGCVKNCNFGVSSTNTSTTETLQ